MCPISWQSGLVSAQTAIADVKWDCDLLTDNYLRGRSGTSGLALKWADLPQINGTNPGHFHISFLFIFSFCLKIWSDLPPPPKKKGQNRAKMYGNLIWKNPGFVLFETNLTYFWANVPPLKPLNNDLISVRVRRWFPRNDVTWAVTVSARQLQGGHIGWKCDQFE